MKIVNHPTLDRAQLQSGLAYNKKTDRSPVPECGESCSI